MTTLHATASKFFTSRFAGRELNVVWHAGEPMTLPIAFYREAFALIQSLNVNGIPVHHHFQTNATLINEEWCAFIREAGIRIGVSVDGPEFIHDRRRLTRQGKGSFARVKKGLELLKAFEIPFSTISVLHDASLEHPDGMFEFLSALEPISAGFNVEETEGVNKVSSLRAESIGKLEAFYHRILELNRKSPRPLILREFPGGEFASLHDLYPSLRPDHRSGNSENRPFRILTVGVNGEISTFSPELIGQRLDRHDNFIFGNIHENRFEDMIYSPAFLRAYKEISRGIEQCSRQCPFFDRCLGGAPAEKIAENGAFDSTRTLSCQLKIQVPHKVQSLIQGSDTGSDSNANQTSNEGEKKCVSR